MARQLKSSGMLMMVFVMALGFSTMQSTYAQKAEPRGDKALGTGKKVGRPELASTLPVGMPDAATTATQGRDPRAEEMVQQLARQAKARHAFRFKFVDEFDDVQQDGRKIQITHLRQGIISRPDRFKIETTGDVANRTIFKDGKTVTLWDRDEKIYAQIPDPGSIDQALDTLMDRYHTAVPSADLFYEDPGKSLLGQITSSEYVGLSTVEGTPCHHLAFSGTDFDWQVWIKAGDAPALRKLVIDYKNLAGRPQYVLRVLSVEPLSTVDGAEFHFSAPAGAELVEMQPASRTENP